MTTKTRAKETSIVLLVLALSRGSPNGFAQLVSRGAVWLLCGFRSLLADTPGHVKPYLQRTVSSSGAGKGTSERCPAVSSGTRKKERCPAKHVQLVRDPDIQVCGRGEGSGTLHTHPDPITGL